MLTWNDMAEINKARNEKRSEVSNVSVSLVIVGDYRARESPAIAADED